MSDEEKPCGCDCIHEDITLCLLRRIFWTCLPIYLRYLIRVVENLVVDLVFVVWVSVTLTIDLTLEVGIPVILAFAAGVMIQAGLIVYLFVQCYRSRRELQTDITTKVRYAVLFKIAAFCNAFYILWVAATYLDHYPYIEPKTTVPTLFPPFPWPTTTTSRTSSTTTTTTTTTTSTTEAVTGSSASIPTVWRTTTDPGPTEFHHQLALAMVTLYALDCLLDLAQLVILLVARICYPECYKVENKDGQKYCMKLAV